MLLFPNIYLRSPFRVVLCFIVFALCGFSVLPLVSVELNPRPTLPVITVSYSLPQASPETVEAQATAPLENVFSQLRELKKTTSVSRHDGGVISLHFDKHSDLNFKRFEVAALIRRTYSTLPKAISYPQIRQGAEYKRQAMPLLSYTINAPYTPAQIKETIAEQIQKPLLLLQGTADVQLQGATEKQIVIAYESSQLAQYKLTPAIIQNKIQQYSTQTHLGGLLTPAGERLYLQSTQTLEELSAIEQIPLQTIQSEARQAVILRLKDVAQVYEEAQPAQQYFRINGQSAISLNLYAQANTNQLLLAQRARQALEGLQASLPTGYQLLLEHDDTKHISEELQKIYYRSGLSVLILVVLLFVLYRDVRYVCALVSSLGITLGLTCFSIYALHITLHLYSLAGLTLSFGLIMDGAIMKLAHLKKYQNTKILRALFGATLCTAVALGLVFMLPEDERQNLTDFALVVILNLVMSFVVAVWFTPAVYQLLFLQKLDALPALATKGNSEALPTHWFMRFYISSILLLKRFQIAFYMLLVLLFGVPVFLLPTQIKGFELYNNTLGNEWYVENIRPTIDRWLGGALRLFVQDVYENAGYREAGKTVLYINAYMPHGTTLAHINAVAQEVEQYIAQNEGLEKFVTNVYGAQSASIAVTFTDKGIRANIPQMLKQKMVSQSIDKAGIEWHVYGVGDGFSSGGGDKIPSFRVEMRGYNYLALEKQASALAKRLIQHKRIQTVNINEKLDFSERASQEWLWQPSAHIKQTAMFSQADVVAAIQTHAEVTYPQMQVLLANNITPILIQSGQARAYNLQSLLLNPLQIQTAQTIRLADVGKVVQANTIDALHRENRQYIRVVGFEYFGSPKFGGEYLDKMLAEMKQTMPVGYEAKKLTYTFGEWDKIQRQYGLLLVLLVAMFIVCSILFENIQQSIFILYTIPIAFIGLFLTFALGGFYFDQGGYAAFFLSGGLVVNAGIYIINDYNNLTHLPAQTRLFQAITHKTIPILLTVFANVLGLLPFLSEGDSEVFWFSLAVGTIGGLIMSLLAIFILLPILMLKK